MISAWLVIIGCLLSIWGVALLGSDAGLALSVLGAAVMIAAVVNELVWHVTEIRVISVFPVHIIVKQEWWE